MPKKEAELQPNFIDLLKKCKRGPQVILPKDAAVIASVTGLRSGWKCLDAGGGSGFLALYLGNLVQPGGKVSTYEEREEHFDIIRENIECCGLEGVVQAKNTDAKNFVEKDLDLVTLDMKGSEKLIKKAHKALKKGGWLVIYSPHIEQQKAAVEEMKALGFGDLQTLETLQRNWQVNEGFTHPVPSGILHTGFLSFGRKI